MITYYNNFDKFKHKIYATLLELPENRETTTVIPQFFKTNQQIMFNNIINSTSRTEIENHLQQVGVANGATN